jgi:anthranilate synthase component 2
MNTLILDNYDSFTYNLYQYVGELGGNPVVHRNDEITVEEVQKLDPTHIVISPGPGNPYTERDVGISEALIDYAEEKKIPLLGVCLGHQVLAKHFGAKVSRAPEVFHGKASKVKFTNPRSLIFQGLDDEIEAMRYHSLHAESVPEHFHLTAETDDGIIMAIEHESLPLYGIQFHPESIGTADGKHILQNFLSCKR